MNWRKILCIVYICMVSFHVHPARYDDDYDAVFDDDVVVQQHWHSDRTKGRKKEKIKERNINLRVREHCCRPNSKIFYFELELN